MAEWTAEATEWYAFVDSSSVKLTGGAHAAVCPVCPDVHPVCRFDAGTLHCVNARCGNPHHRPRIEEFPF